MFYKHRKRLRWLKVVAKCNGEWGADLERRKILILSGVFLATLPISYIINGLFVAITILIGDILRGLAGSQDLVLIAGVSYALATILMSLFFTTVAWLLLSVEKNSIVQTKGGK